MQSASYVPGVSGWKMHKDGRLEVEGVVRVMVSPLADEKTEPKPFIIVDGVTYISATEVDRASIAKAKIESMWSVKLRLDSQGQYFAAGIGVGVGDAVIVAEASARASADEAMSSSIGALETRIGSLALEALAIKGAIDAAAALNRK